MTPIVSYYSSDKPCSMPHLCLLVAEMQAIVVQTKLTNGNNLWHQGDAQLSLLHIDDELPHG